MDDTTSPSPDPRPAFTTAARTAREVIAAVRPDQLGDPTPCTEFDVRALLGHLLAVCRRVTVIGAGGDPFDIPDEIIGVDDDDWTVQWDRAAAEVDEVWRDDAVLTRVLTLPWTELPGAAALPIYVNEVTVHTWDLATAIGVAPQWDPDVVAMAFDAVRAAMPDEGRAEMFAATRAAAPIDMSGWPDPFLAVTPVADDAPAIDRLVAWNGRTP